MPGEPIPQDREYLRCVPCRKDSKENDYFPHPVITPSTKAETGHDEDISKEEIIASGLVNEKDYAQLMEEYTLTTFPAGKRTGCEKRIILVDTKYEFGKIGNTIYLMDEIHTPDSSGYFYSDGFEERQKKGEKQKQLSKEFVQGMADCKRVYGQIRAAGSGDVGRMGANHLQQLYRII